MAGLLVSAPTPVGAVGVGAATLLVIALTPLQPHHLRPIGGIVKPIGDKIR